MNFCNRLVPVYLAGIFLGGCSSSSPPDSTTAGEQLNTSVTTAESLYGTWESSCSNDGPGTTYRYSQWEFNSTESSAITYSYSTTDAQCSSPTDSTSRKFEVTYLAETQETSLGLAIKTDLTILEWTMMNSSEVVWNSNVDGIPADVTSEYQIFLVADNRLYGGSIESGDATTPQTRPTVIDEINWLTKKT